MAVYNVIEFLAKHEKLRSDCSICCQHSFCKDHSRRSVFVVADDSIWEDTGVVVVLFRNSREHKDPINCDWN
ncbi:hypothetical protein ACS0PU_005294 [Formica fusca]